MSDKEKNTKKRLIENFFSLSLLQVANYILPLITIPYLVRILGPEKFGLVAFAQAFIQYFVFLTDYGFNLSAVQKISICRDDNQKISQIFSTVFSIKFLFCVLSFFILASLVFSIDKFRSDWELYFVTFGMVLGNLLLPIWLFQGMEKMKYITIFNFIARLIFTVSIFFFVKRPDDYLNVVLLNSIGFVFAGILSFYTAIRIFKIAFYIPSIKEIWDELCEGFYFFLSIFASNLYTVSNVFILGLLTNNTIVGYYSAGERLIRAIQGSFSPVSQTIYPHMSSLAQKSREQAMAFINKIIKFSGIIYLALSLVIFFMAKQIVSVVFGSQYSETILIIKIMSFIPLVAVIGNILGTQIMLNFEMKKYFAVIIVSASILNIIFAFPLIILYKHYGLAVCILSIESLITLSMCVFLKKRGFNLFNLRRV